MSDRPDVTLLVNSSDGFEDCWGPFVHFLRHYWPDCAYSILLNTETKDWSSPSVELRTSRVGTGAAARLSWSDCLIRAIDQVATPLLLYFQEDYFIEKPVRDDVVSRAVQLMLDHPEIGHIALTRHGSVGPFAPSPYPGFSVISRNARYRISTQAALWRPDVLRSYLDPRENGWMFEILGTKRASKRDDLFLVADFTDAAGGPAVLAQGASQPAADAGPSVITEGAKGVSIGGAPAARAGDRTSDGNAIAKGSPNVFINGRPAVTLGDTTGCGGVVVGGASNVFINGKPVARAGDLATGCAGKSK